MKQNRTEPTGTENRPAEAELFAEILNRLDEKKQGGAGSGEPPRTRTLDFVELFYYMLSKLHFLLLGMVLGAVLLGAYASSSITPIYTATSKLYIMGSTGSSIIADLQIGTVLFTDPYAPVKITEGLTNYMDKNGVKTLSELTGAMRPW